MISIVVPIYNEEKSIEKFIQYIFKNCSYKNELILVDGKSSDKTVQIINNYIYKNKVNNFVLIENKKRYVSYALNKAIKISKYEIIVRMDVHTKYSNDYFDSIIQTFNKTNADIVGGPTDTIFEGKKQESIAYCYSHKFGMGGGKVHNMKYNGFTNGVTFGAFKKYVFKNNFFDTDLIRNQDDEFFSRCTSLGFKIYQSSKIKLYYSPRKNYFGLYKQYFQYGYYKPLALKKAKNSLRIRQLVPPTFILYLIISISIKQYLLLIYLFPLLYYSLINKKSIDVKIMNIFSFFIMHFSYGTGFIVGLKKIF
jgi:glycosyltransferase involved in cell wall biosynthesis